MFDTIEDRFGPVLVLVNNAGVRTIDWCRGSPRLGSNHRREPARRFHTIQRAIRPMVQMRSAGSST
jgi:NAD(P)-dependent dehydrogenase (short-subunit alcohol dehydrogenase family)